MEAGQPLLHYRLIEKIDEGGMGVVWQVTDTKLEREVAIKILPAPFVADSGSPARFQREAKVLASIYRFEEALNVARKDEVVDRSSIFEGGFAAETKERFVRFA